jgi:phage shock protein A
MGTLLVALGVIALAGLLISGKLRTLVKGFIGLFVEDVAKTPEGAAAVYTEAIDKAQDDYNKASNALQKIAGQLQTAKMSLQELQIKIKSCEEKCERFASLGQFEKVEMYGQERQDLMEEKDHTETVIKNLSPIFEEAKKLTEFNELKLVKLKKEKVNVVNNLKLNKQLKEMYDDMDELKNTSNIDKLLEAVKEGSKESMESATGAKVLHESKRSTKLSNADAEVKAMQNSDYVDSLKKKYQKQV